MGGNQAADVDSGGIPRTPEDCAVARGADRRGGVWKSGTGAVLFEGRTGGAVWAMPGLAVIGGCVAKWSVGRMARGGRVLECEFVGDRVPEGASGGNAIVATKHCRRECVKFVGGLCLVGLESMSQVL